MRFFLKLILGCYFLSSCHTRNSEKQQNEHNDTTQTSATYFDTLLRYSDRVSMFVLDTTSTDFQGDTVGRINEVLQVVADFDHLSKDFQHDTFVVFYHTTEGCEIIAVNDGKTDFIKLYGTLFGEMGKQEFKYYLFTTPQLYCVVSSKVHYDRPITEDGSKVDTSYLFYEIYAGNKLIAVLDKNKQRIKATGESLQWKEKHSRDFFEEYIGQIKIEK